MSSPDRQELMRNAVAFLVDPKVRFGFIQICFLTFFIFEKTQASPVSQRIQFLEAKGLTPTEIDTAMKQAAYSSSPAVPYSGLYHNPYAFSPRQNWDWRDYFVSGPELSQVWHFKLTRLDHCSSLWLGCLWCCGSF